MPEAFFYFSLRRKKMTIKYDAVVMKTMSLFENITKAMLKDFYIDEVNGMMTFVVMPGNMRNALGKDASNVKRMQAKFEKRIKIVEYNDDVLRFIRNMIMPLKADDIERTGENEITIHSDDTQTKGLLIGRNAANLRNLEKNVQRYFSQIKEIKVV